MMETFKSIPKYSKYCLVPQCQSSSIRTPGKVFISLPVGLTAKQRKKRALWLQAMRRNKNDISENTRGFVCEDHFNLEEDMENYMRFKMMGGNISLKEHVVPHVFSCQIDRKQSSNVTERSYAVKRDRKDLINTLLYKEIISTEEGTDNKITPINIKHSVAEQSTDLTKSDQQSPHCTYIQNDAKNISQRTVSTQHRPNFRSKFVQTDLCFATTVGTACSPFKSIKLDHVPYPSKFSNIVSEKDVTSASESTNTHFDSDSCSSSSITRKDIETDAIDLLGDK